LFVVSLTTKLFLLFAYPLIFLENAGTPFFLFALEISSPPCPSILRIKTEVQVGTFFFAFNAFRKACAAVNRLAFSRLKRYGGVFATVIAFDLKYSFL
jgi:hypothetical protein